MLRGECIVRQRQRLLDRALHKLSGLGEALILELRDDLPSLYLVLRLRPRRHGSL
jgi:hypothetical protein